MVRKRSCVRIASTAPHLRCANCSPQVFSIFGFCARVYSGDLFYQCLPVESLDAHVAFRALAFLRFCARVYSGDLFCQRFQSRASTRTSRSGLLLYYSFAPASIVDIFFVNASQACGRQFVMSCRSLFCVVRPRGYLFVAQPMIG